MLSDLAVQINDVVDEAGQLVLSVGNVTEGMLALGVDGDQGIDNTILSGMELVLNVSSSIDDSLHDLQSDVENIGDSIKVQR